MKRESEIKLDYAELFFKFALAASLTIENDPNCKLNYYGSFTYGKHTLTYNDLKLNRKEETLGAGILEHVGTYILVLQLDKVLEDELEGNCRFQHRNLTIVTVSRIVHLIRNTFAHDPFKPTWLIHKCDKDREYCIPKILTLNTKGLNGKRVKREHYGGPIALLKLLQYTRKLVEEAT